MMTIIYTYKAAFCLSVLRLYVLEKKSTKPLPDILRHIGGTSPGTCPGTSPGTCPGTSPGTSIGASEASN